MTRLIRASVTILAGLLAAVRGEGMEAAPRDAILNDWLLQDGATPAVFEGADPEPVLALLRRVRAERPAPGAAEALPADNLPANPDARRALYREACEARRRHRLEPLLKKYRTWVFVKARTVQPSFFAYTEGQSDAQHEAHFLPGSALCLLHLDGLYGRVETLLRDEGGVFRDPDVSWDGTRLLFAWKRSRHEDDYHLYEMDASTRAVRQLTFGLGAADYDGTYLPGSGLVFASSRCVQTTDCWWTEVSNLYLCDGDGRYLRRVGFDQVSTISPSVLHDGRVVYTRWDYNDRGQLFPQPLFVMSADGTGQTEYYGNNSWFPTVLTHARAIPGSPRVVAIGTGHHAWQAGKLCLVDIAKGRQENQGVQWIAPRRETKPERVDAMGQFGDRFQHPWPLDEQHFIVSYVPDGDGPGGRRDAFGLYFMDADGRRELLAWDPALPCNFPVPLAARPEPPRPASPVDYRREDGLYTMQDIHAGPGLAGVPRGRIKRLRVIALDYRAAGVGNNSNGGPAGGALVSTPIAVGNGAWDVKRVLGEATVHEDGSAAFRVPARTPVYFQAIDADGHAAQTMRSWSTLQPGETYSCVGCHEDKNAAAPPLRATPLALARGIQDLAPFQGPARGFHYRKEVQPILDRHCISCHDANHRLELTGRTVEDRVSKRLWTASYLALTGANPDGQGAVGRPDGPHVRWPGSQSVPSMLPPYFAGSATSPLLKSLREGHHDVALSRAEYETLACWIDLAVPFCGDYVEANAWNDEEKKKYAHFEAKRTRLTAEDAEALRAMTHALETGEEAPSPAQPLSESFLRPYRPETRETPPPAGNNR